MAEDSMVPKTIRCGKNQTAIHSIHNTPIFHDESLFLIFGVLTYFLHLGWFCKRPRDGVLLETIAKCNFSLETSRLKAFGVLWEKSFKKPKSVGQYVSNILGGIPNNNVSDQWSPVCLSFWSCLELGGL